MPAGGRQQPTGDITAVAPTAVSVGAKLVNRLSDYYAGWPYQFSWNTWTPNAYRITITPGSGGGPTSAPTTPPTTPPGGSGCSASVTVNQWNGGFVATVRVTAGSASLNGWTAGVTLPSDATVTSAWNAKASGAGGSVSFTNAGYNGAVPAGAYTEFGFQGTGTGPSATPTCAAR